MRRSRAAPANHRRRHCFPTRRLPSRSPNYRHRLCFWARRFPLRFPNSTFTRTRWISMAALLLVAPISVSITKLSMAPLFFWRADFRCDFRIRLLRAPDGYRRRLCSWARRFPSRLPNYRRRRRFQTHRFRVRLPNSTFTRSRRISGKVWAHELNTLRKYPIIFARTSKRVTPKTVSGADFLTNRFTEPQIWEVIIAHFEPSYMHPFYTSLPFSVL